jgi:hypothetical protein
MPPIARSRQNIGSAFAVQSEHDGGDAIEHVAVVRYQHQRAGKIDQAFFQNFQRRNVEVVGGFVEQENVGGLEHELRDQDARAFASGKAADGLAELLAGKQESCAAHPAT